VIVKNKLVHILVMILSSSARQKYSTQPKKHIFLRL